MAADLAGLQWLLVELGVEFTFSTRTDECLSVVVELFGFPDDRFPKMVSDVKGYFSRTLTDRCPSKATDVDLTTEQGALTFMQRCINYAEWLANREAVREANGGNLPDWFEADGGRIATYYARIAKLWAQCPTVRGPDGRLSVTPPQELTDPSNAGP